MKTPDLPITKPTLLELKLWSRVRPRKVGGLIARGCEDTPRRVMPCAYGPRDKNNIDHWDCKMKGGPDAEWWAYMMEGACRVLDVGCGSGFPSFYLASLGHDVFGVDPSRSEIAAADRYRSEEGQSYKLHYAVIGGTELPFDDNSFNGATFSGSVACMGEPERLIAEVKRVLRPGAKVAFDEEDRALEPKTHPVSEKIRIVMISGEPNLWVETRICDPYLTRRYLIPLRGLQPCGSLWKERAAGAELLAASPEEWGLSVDDLLQYADGGDYGEAVGYDPFTLRDFIERMGFTDLKFWCRNNGRMFAEELKRQGVLDQMPDDIRAVLRALVRSLPPLSGPTTLVSGVMD